MGRIITKNRNPRISEFGTDDFVLNTKTGDLFAKANNKLFKIASRDIKTNLSTDTVLALLPPSTTKDTVLTDLLEYKELTITSANSGSFLSVVSISGKNYYNLDLSKIKAMFVRLDDSLLYPIATITPPTITNRSHTMYLESAHSTGHYISNTGFASSVETRVDAGDLVAESFITRTVGGVSYPDTIKISNGCRAMLVRSKFDWKIQSLSDFSNVTASFGHVKGNITLDGGSF